MSKTIQILIQLKGIFLKGKYLNKIATLYYYTIVGQKDYKPCVMRPNFMTNLTGSGTI